MSGRYNYVVGSNVTNFFAIGDFLKKDDFYLTGYHQPNGKIIVSGKVFSSTGKALCTLEDKELVSLDANNVLVWKTIEDNELEIIDKEGVRIFHAKTIYKKVPTAQGFLETNITELIGDFYDKKGGLVATGSKDELYLQQVKGIFGATKSGSLGIVIGYSTNETDFIREFVRKNL